MLVLFGLLFLLLWLVPEVPLLGFAAVLLALALHAGVIRWRAAPACRTGPGC
ncbi:hypothetical protein [Dankookia sp. P2]|uniref:hypothetical protein n=1 Tax=Dankookia sp. P2 TaxID=3423955 RepID=UPI003D67D552